MTSSPEMQRIAPNSNYDAFGAVLRFWRIAFNLSQEALAERAEISVRHLSFLENGRTCPSASVLLRLVNGIGLREREAGVLYVAAGRTLFECNRDSGVVPGNIPKDWINVLRHADPMPSSIMDRFGRIVAVNRAWVALHRLCIGDIAEGDNLNAIELYLHAQGWRRHIRHWTDAACVMLTIVHQEAMLVRNLEILRKVKRWTATPGLPRDWPIIGVQLSRERSDYCYDIEFDIKVHSVVNIVHATLGYFPADRNTYIVQTMYPDRIDMSEVLHNASASPVAHSLCPY